MKGAVEQAKPWTERHVAEARAVFCDAAKASILRGSDSGARALDGARGDGGSFASSNEESFRLYLSYLDGFGQSSAIDAAVRRVRARAEGREVVIIETRWHVRWGSGYQEDHDSIEANARRIAKRGVDRRVVKVTVTRRRVVSAKATS